MKHIKRLWFFLWYVFQRYQYHSFHAWFAEMHTGHKIDVLTRAYVFFLCMAMSIQDWSILNQPAPKREPFSLEDEKKAEAMAGCN